MARLMSCRDIVDTEHFSGNVWKMLIGSFAKFTDDDENNIESYSLVHTEVESVDPKTNRGSHTIGAGSISVPPTDSGYASKAMASSGYGVRLGFDERLHVSDAAPSKSDPTDSAYVSGPQAITNIEFNLVGESEHEDEHGTNYTSSVDGAYATGYDDLLPDLALQLVEEAQLNDMAPNEMEKLCTTAPELLAAFAQRIAYRTPNVQVSMDIMKFIHHRRKYVVELSTVVLRYYWANLSTVGISYY
jgi:hypothetical protein